MKQEILTAILCIFLCVGSLSTFFASELYSKYIHKNIHERLALIRGIGVLVCVISMLGIYIL